MSAVVRMRLVAFLRTGRVVPSALATLIVVGVLYGGGQAEATEAYGLSALLLFPVLAWQTKLLLDAEPDVQRRLAGVVLGSAARERAAGLVAAALATVPPILVALLLPWLFGAVTAKHVGSALLLGVWAHAIVIPAALALGGWSSRAVTGTAGRATAVLATGVVLAFVLGLRGSPVPWLVPPLMGTARGLAGGIEPAAVAGFTAWALVWAALALAGYGWLRRTRP
jgi:hypothetical protein